MIDVADLTLAFTRRKRFEMKLLANEMAKIMSASFGTNSAHTAPQQPTDHVHPDILFNQMGVTIQ